MVKHHVRKSHAYNKRYDRSAKDCEFTVGEYVYLYNPVVKAGVPNFAVHGLDHGESQFGNPG
jgi:hypothetical protein